MDVEDDHPDGMRKEAAQNVLEGLLHPPGNGE